VTESGPDALKQKLQAKVVTVSDGVVAGTREDRSGQALADALVAADFEVVSRTVVPDGVVAVAGELVRVCVDFAGLVVTTGGTGFAPRDQTPEGTAEILTRHAPGLAEAMRLVSPLGRLSRGVAGIRNQAVVINTPGSPAGAVECLGAVIDVIPHALALLANEPTHHPHP
jgi:molybdopterin adenylyltransferase